MRIGPSVGNGTLLPVAILVKQKSRKSFRPSKRRAPRRPIPADPAIPPQSADQTPKPFRLELIRPAQPGGKTGVTIQQQFDPLPGDTRDHTLGVRLLAGQLYSVTVNGELVAESQGDGSPVGPLAVLTVRGWATPEMLACIGVNTSSPRPAVVFGFLFVPICAALPCEADLDGRQLFNLPGA